MPVSGSSVDKRRSSAVFAAVALVRLDQQRVQPAAFQQQHHQHEARCQQAIDPAGIEAKVEAAGIEDGAERDVQDPRAHHHHQPQVEHRLRPAPPHRDQGKQAERADGGHHDDHRRSVAVALHDGRKRVMALRGEQPQPSAAVSAEAMPMGML